MHRISSNWTIFLKIFLPTAWITFFGLLTIGVYVAEPGFLPWGGGMIFKIAFLVGFFIFLAFLYFTVMRLKRVDFGEDGVYVSNYFKTYRYLYQDVASLEDEPFPFFRKGKIVLNAPGKFGQNIHFLVSKVHLDAWLEKNADKLAHLSND